MVQPRPEELQSSVHQRCMFAAQDMVSARTRDGRTILHSACASSNVDVVKRLLAAGAAVNVQSDDGATPLARVTPRTHIQQRQSSLWGHLNIVHVGQGCPSQMHTCDAVSTMLDCIHDCVMAGPVAGLLAGCLTQMSGPLCVRAPQLLNAHVIWTASCPFRHKSRITLERFS